MARLSLDERDWLLAGLPELQLDLETFSQPEQVRALDAHGGASEWGHEGTAAWFAGIEDVRCRFGVAEERLTDLATVYLGFGLLTGRGAGAHHGVV